MTPEEAKQKWKERAEWGWERFSEYYLDGIKEYKSALLQEIEKMQDECTDDLEYKVLDQLKDKLNTITPKP